MIVPQELQSRKQWLIWRFEKDAERPEKTKLLKVPYYVDGGRRFGDQGNDEDRRRLATFEAAMKARPKSGSDVGCGGIGFAFLPALEDGMAGDGLIGIDLDNVIDLDTGEMSEQAIGIIKACSSYTEYSPSKKGVHIFVVGDTKQLLGDKLGGKTGSFKSNKIGVEVFCGGQFFTYTGDHYSGTPREVSAIAREVLENLHATVRGARQRSGSAPGRAPAGPGDELRRVESALPYIDADDYHQWIEIGHALKRGLGEMAFGAWDRWSARSAKYPGSQAAHAKWQTFDVAEDGVKLGTVFELAKRGGWTPPRAPKRLNTAAPGSRGTGSAPPPPPDEEDPPPDPAGEEGLPLIQIKAGELERIIDEAEAALIASPNKVYQRSGMLVRVVRKHVRTVRNYSGRTDTLGFHVVEQPYLVEKFTSAARWEKFNARAKEWQRANCPDHIAGMYMARAGHWRLPKLWSVITAPTLRPDGTVLQKPGYDEATGTWFDPCGVDYPKIPDAPTYEQAKKAMQVLRDVFQTVPFNGEVDRAVLFSMVLTGLVRRSLPSAPLGAISAFQPSSGKTLLADAIGIIAMGTPPPAMKFPDTDEEAAKTALAMLAAGDPVLLIDNVERPLQGDWLCSILTSETYRQRVLGRTEMMDVPTTTLFLATGNHLTTAGDMSTRALLCGIDPKTEHPEKRKFDYDLREYVSARRPELVAAGLTIMRAFITTGEVAHMHDHVDQWGRFEAWTRMVRAPLVWLGCSDPCEALSALEKEDPERGELLRMMHAWKQCFGSMPTTARQAVAHVADVLSMLSEDQRALREILSEVGKDRAGEINVKKVAKWLQRHVGRRLKGQHFVKAGEQDHVALWKLEVLTAG